MERHRQRHQRRASSPPRSGRFSPVFNPATGEQTAELGLSSAAEVDRAVAGGQGGGARTGAARRR